MKNLNQQVIADTIIAIFAIAFLAFGFSGDSLIYKLSITWGAMCSGYLLTIYLSVVPADDEETTGWM